MNRSRGLISQGAGSYDNTAILFDGRKVETFCLYEIKAGLYKVVWDIQDFGIESIRLPLMKLIW
jgi:hypothetical protein